MALIPISLPPGVVRTGRESGSEGRWYDTDLVRWYSGALQPINGWRRLGTEEVQGVPSSVLPWRDNAGNTRFAIGTTKHLYISDLGGNLDDILVGGVATGTSSLTSVSPNASDHTDGTYTGVSLTGGTGSGVIATVQVSSGAVTSVDVTTSGSGYVYDDVLTIPSSTIGGAADETVVVSELTTFSAGRGSGTQLVGYGTGEYDGDWGYGLASTGSGTVGILDAANWSLDTWGEYLVGVMDGDGQLWEWQLTGDAAVVANAPTGNQSVLVTDERIVMCLGAGGDPRLVQWSDQEDNTTWAPATSNQAGDQTLATTGRVLTGRRVRGGVLILTTTDAHLAQYTGPPFVYQFTRVGDNCGLIGSRAIVSGDAITVWMGEEAFYLYDGSVRPLPCSVSDYVFNDLNSQQRAKIWGMSLPKFREFWFFYPSGSSSVCDRYVVWNSAENHWSLGTLSRAAGANASGVNLNPLLLSESASETGRLYEHEVGWDYDGATPYAESGPFSIGVGDRYAHVTQLIPDDSETGSAHDTTISFYTRPYPTGDETTHGPYTLAEPTSVRFGGRQIRIRIAGATSGDWRVGPPKLEIVPGERR